MQDDLKTLVPGALRQALRRGAFGYRRLTGARRMLPDFLVIGGQRCGSTSLYNLLIQHPRIAPAFRKEIQYWSLRCDRSLAWYRSHFPLARAGEAGIRSGEATPYYLFHPAVPARIRAVLPDVKLIAVLREPVARAYSHYQHEVRSGREAESFEEAIRLEPERLRGERERLLRDPGYYSFEHHRHAYLARGAYAEQLAEWLRHFSRDQMLVMDSRELFEHPGWAVNRAFRFLGLPEFHVPDQRARNAAEYSAMKPAVREHLTRHFGPLNEALFELLGECFDW